MRREGLSGAFIVLPRPQEERTDIPRVDKDLLLITQDWSARKSDVEAVAEQNWYMLQFGDNFKTEGCFPSVRTYDGSLSTLARPYSNALINGKSKSFSEDSTENQRSVPLEIFSVTHNSSTRFRIVNTGSTGEYKISIDEHRLLLIASDGSDLSPLWIDYLFINPGETFDVILVSNNTPGNFWIRVATIQVMDINFNQIQTNVSFAQLHYQEAEKDLPDSEERKCTESEPCVMANCHWSQVTMSKWEPYSTCLSIADLKGMPSAQNSESPIAVPESPSEFQEFFLNFHFTGSDALLERPAVNSIHYKSPPVPLQMHPDIVKDKGVVCDNQNMDQCDAFCKCTHVVKLAKKKVTQIVLMADDGLPRGVSHPVHLHGNRFYVVKNANGDINKTTGITQAPNPDIEYSSDMRSATWRNSSWKHGNVPGINLKDPPLKDTVMIPYRGYVVIRFISDKIGFWLMHCHLEAHMDIGMAVVLQVGEEHEQPQYPEDIPKCSNYDPESTTKPAHDSAKDLIDNNFLQMPGSEGKTNLGPQNREVSGMTTTQVVMVVFFAMFVTGIMVFSFILLVKYCGRRRGYRRIDKDQRVIFQK